jgi:hypothetical protein
MLLLLLLLFLLLLLLLQVGRRWASCAAPLQCPSCCRMHHCPVQGLLQWALHQNLAPSSWTWMPGAAGHAAGMLGEPAAGTRGVWLCCASPAGHRPDNSMGVMGDDSSTVHQQRARMLQYLLRVCIDNTGVQSACCALPSICGCCLTGWIHRRNHQRAAANSAAIGRRVLGDICSWWRWTAWPSLSISMVACRSVAAGSGVNSGVSTKMASATAACARSRACRAEQA